MTESELTRQWCAKAEAAGASVLPVVAGAMGRSGWPDRYFAYMDADGQFGAAWLEFKAHNGKLKPAQRAVIARLLKNGARAYVARFVDATAKSALRIEAVSGNEIILCKTTMDLLLFISQLERGSAPLE